MVRERDKKVGKDRSGTVETSLVVQWLRPCIPNARGLISIRGPELDPTCYNEELARVWQPQ